MIPESGSRLGVVLLWIAGLGLVLFSFYLNRLSWGGPYGQGPAWMEALSWPFETLFEASFGTFPRDVFDQSGQDVRIAATHQALAWGSIVYFALAVGVVRSPLPKSPWIQSWILGVAIFARLVLTLCPPLLETDPCRYLWDGAVLAEGISPYRYSPGEVTASGRLPPGTLSASDQAALDRLRELSIQPRLSSSFRKINHPQVPTLYPPLAQLFFAALARLSPGDVFLLKFALAMVDILLLGLLAFLLEKANKPPSWILLYAWCPVLLKETVASAHYDVLAALFVVAGLAALKAHARVVAGLLLAAGSLVKFYPLALALVLARDLRARGQAAFWLPFLSGLWIWRLSGPDPSRGLRTFAVDWVRHAGVYEVLRGALELGLPERGAQLGAKLLVVAVAGAWVLGLASARLLRSAGAPKNSIEELALRALFLPYLLAPVMNPWYLSWTLPLAAWTGRLAPVLLAAGASVYGFSFLAADFGVRTFGFAFDLRWLEFLPVVWLGTAEGLFSMPSRRRT